MKLFKMTLKILANHAAAVFLTFVMMLFLSFLSNNIVIFSVIATLIYAGLVYSAGWNVGRKDSRKLPDCVPDVKKAVKAGLIFACIPFVLLIFRVICPFVFPLQWRPYGEGYTMIQALHPVTQIADMSYRIFFFPCIGFMQKGDLLSYVLPILIVPVLVPVGYIIGLKRFSIIEQYMPKVFYKDKNSASLNKKNK